ncbi:MAG: 5'/3'-nucleotidase SurE [Acidimicrobiia bacterium]|nr:5'/3'-nucleotidase SurE [Acidimicrobiia bacterium]
MRSVRLVAMATALLLVASGCQMLQSAQRYAAAPGTVPKPFWCAPSAGTALTPADCTSLSAQLDLAALAANRHHTAGDALGDGAIGTPYVPGVGAAFRFRAATPTFDAARPDTLLYDSTNNGAQIAGIEWNITGQHAPAGFTGPNDLWTAVTGGWRLRAWILRPFQHEPNVFNATHPCLTGLGAVYDVTASCYTNTHLNPLRVLVSNDDGVDAPGIDAAVEVLRKLPNVSVSVVAPATNQSGSGGNTSPDPLVANPSQTASGYPATAVQGFPADAVRYALQVQHLNPDLIVSGINNGQNLGPITGISGTLGAARVGGRAEIPSVALSQGLGSPPDFPSGAFVLVAWVNDFLLGRVGPQRFQSVVNINIPTCTAGAIRGSRFLPLATDTTSGNPVGNADCTSTVTNTVDDIAGFLNGFVTISSIGT